MPGDWIGNHDKNFSWIGNHDKKFSKQMILDLKLKFHKFKNTPKKKIELI